MDQRFIDYIRQYPQLQILERSLTTPPEVSVRVNPAKDGASLFADADRVPWCDTGRYLADRPAFTFDPAMHQGRYYVQDASSMAIDAVVRALADGRPVRYLDMCAAPGGKTTCAISALPAGSVVVANEYDYKRAEILAENIAKWGGARVLVSRGDTSRLAKLAGQFDIVSVDAPCSGEGMMRKDAQAVAQWSPSLVERCAATQRQILGNAWAALKPGGYLVYSTCTFNRVEDEENLQWLVDEYDATPVEIDALSSFEQIERGIDTVLPCYRFLPGRVRGEGLFLAVVRKAPGGAVEMRANSKSDPKLSVVNTWLTGDNVVFAKGDEVYAVPADAAAFLLKAASVLDTLTVGVRVATVKGKDLVPAHQLAVSQLLKAAAFPSVDLSLDDAVRYLQREAVTLPDDTSRGYVLLTYQRHPLGFVKHLGNRSNNLYPKNWRILSHRQ